MIVRGSTFDCDPKKLWEVSDPPTIVRVPAMQHQSISVVDQFQSRSKKMTFHDSVQRMNRDWGTHKRGLRRSTGESPGGGGSIAAKHCNSENEGLMMVNLMVVWRLIDDGYMMSMMFFWWLLVDCCLMTIVWWLIDNNVMIGFSNQLMLVDTTYSIWVIKHFIAKNGGWYDG